MLPTMFCPDIFTTVHKASQYPDLVAPREPNEAPPLPEEPKLNGRPRPVVRDGLAMVGPESGLPRDGSFEEGADATGATGADKTGAGCGFPRATI